MIPIAAVNPVAKLGAGLIVSLFLIVTIDWVSATTALLLELSIIAFMGIEPRRFWLRTLPVWLAAPLTALTIMLYGRYGGDVYFEFLFIRISDGSVELALATFLRVLAIGLPAVVLFISIDPTDFADGLAQRLRLPDRFVLGALAAVRMVGLFLDDWRSLELARRARGVADRGRLRRVAGQGFALLVLSIRRGSKLSIAMEARGFGGDTPRTWARESRWGAAEWITLIVGLLIGVAATVVAVLTGSWTFIAR
ncbi:ABC-type cobalt transport system [marine actinobacterium PHSC20C1]|nr:ABC-type cobalt transport system [marine actinobacterium PHSC20C1]